MQPLVWKRPTVNAPPRHPPPFGPVLLSSSFLWAQSGCCAATGTRGKWGWPPLRCWLQPIKWPHLTLPYPTLILSFTLHYFIPSARRKHAGLHFAEKTFCYNCCAVRFSGLQDFRLYPNTHWWTSVPLTLQRLQLCRVIYGMRRTHPPYLLLSTFMSLAVCRGPVKQSYYPSTALDWRDKSALAPFKKGGTEFICAMVGD